MNTELQELHMKLEDTVNSNRRELRTLQENWTEQQIRADNTLREVTQVHICH